MSAMGFCIMVFPMRRAMVLSSLILLLLAVYPARCMAVLMDFSAPVGFPGETPTEDHELHQLAGLGLSFWSADGVPKRCGQIVISLADDLTVDSVDASGRGGACTIVFTRRWLEGTREAIAAADRGTEIRFRAGECLTVVHEVGHALGLPHDDSLVMGSAPSTPPGLCVAWAASVTPRRHSAHPHKTPSLRRYRGHVSEES